MGLEFHYRAFIRDEVKTCVLLPLELRGPGTYRVKIDCRVNSLLSTLYIKAKDAGATVSASYYDFTTDGDGLEKNFLRSHLPIVGAPGSDKLIVVRHHDKPYLEVTIAGGDAEVSVYGTGIGAFASEMSQALYLDGQAANLVIDKAAGQAFYNPVTGNWEFARIYNGGLITTPFWETNLVTDWNQDFFGVTTPGVEQTLWNVTVPVGKIANLSKLVVTCRSHGSYKLILDDTTVIAGGRTSPADPNAAFPPWKPFRKIAAGVNIKLLFTAQDSSVDGQDLGAHLNVFLK